MISAAEAGNVPTAPLFWEVPAGDDNRFRQGDSGGGCGVVQNGDWMIVKCQKPDSWTESWTVARQKEDWVERNKQEIMGSNLCPGADEIVVERALRAAQVNGPIGGVDGSGNVLTSFCNGKPISKDELLGILDDTHLTLAAPVEPIPESGSSFDLTEAVPELVRRIPGVAWALVGGAIVVFRFLLPKAVEILMREDDDTQPNPIRKTQKDYDEDILVIERERRMASKRYGEPTEVHPPKYHN